MKNKMILMVFIGMMLVLMTAWTVKGQDVCPPGGVDKDHPGLFCVAGPKPVCPPGGVDAEHPGMRCIAGLPPLIRTTHGPNIMPLRPLTIAADEGGSGGVQIQLDTDSRPHWQPTRTPWAYP